MAANVLDMLRESSGDTTYHPLSSLLKLAGEADATIPDQINIHRAIAKYVEAERKSIDVKNAYAEPINFSFKLR